MAQRVALLLAALVLSVGLCELILRLAAPQPRSWLAIYRRHPTLDFHALQPDVRAEVSTGETDWLVLTDSDGFRSDGEPPAPRSCTALWLGDSFAFGHGVDFEESLVGLVAARAPEVAHRNAAVPGYGPVQYRRILEYELSKGPPFEQLNVVTYVGNDFHDCIWNKNVAVNDGIVGHRRDLKSYLQDRSHLYRLAAAAYHRVRPHGGSTPFQQVLDQLSDPQAWRASPLAEADAVYAREMSLIGEIASENHVDLRFLVLPTRDAVEQWRRGVHEGAALLPVSRALAALRETGASVLDATPALAARPTTETFFSFDGHLTPEGNAIAAEVLLARHLAGCANSRNGH